MEVLGVVVVSIVVASLAGLALYGLLLGAAGAVVLARSRRADPLEVELERFLGQLLESPPSRAVAGPGAGLRRGAPMRRP